MSDDELERLAAEMKNIKPTENARKRGMDAAMAAFDAEFAQDTAQETVKHKNTPDEKNSQAIQGSVSEPRPTGQTTTRNGIMSKFKNMFSIEPKAMMMMGSCAAALTFAFVIISPTDLTPPKDEG